MPVRQRLLRQFHDPLMGENILDDNAWNGPVLFPECFVLREIHRAGRFSHFNGNAWDCVLSLLDPVFIAAAALAS